MYLYPQYPTNFIIVNAGESVVVDPVEYTITFDVTHKGNEKLIKVKSVNTFVKIRINAKNTSEEKTMISVSQFYLIDEKQQKYQPVYGGFSTDLVHDDSGLLTTWLEPNKPVMLTTQFDVPYDELKQYNVVIRPTNQQSSMIWQ